MLGLEHSQRPVVGGSGRISKMTMCVSGGATKANKLRQTWISADVLQERNAASPPRAGWSHFTAARLRTAVAPVRSRHHFIWHRQRVTNLPKYFDFEAPLGFSVLHLRKLYRTKSGRRLQFHRVRAPLLPEATHC